MRTPFPPLARGLFLTAFCLFFAGLVPSGVRFPGSGLRAQIGLNPPEVDWKKIDTRVGRVIFPEGYAERAQRVATLIELLEAKHNRSVGTRHYPFDLVLQTPNMRVNGFVALAPFRSELFVTPPQSLSRLSGTDWVDLLTLHEYRHVQQNSNERRGITKLFSFLQGQYGWAVTSALATPNWFTEGDAVVAETALSSAGRGRLPAFSDGLRSLLAADVNYSYPKARNGSLKDFVPDHYRYGYAMVTYARERYGNDFWKSILQDGAAYRSLLYPFSSALKKKTGMNTRQLYGRTLADLAARQDSALAARPPLVAGKPVGPPARVPTDYLFPAVDGTGRLLALRSGFQHTPALVAVDPAGGKDRVVVPVGIQREPYVYVRGRLATWMEARQNPRYTVQEYSDIFVYDLVRGDKWRLTRNGKFLAPAFSFDRKTVVAVEDDPSKGLPSIVLFDSQNGEEKGRYATDANAVSYPRFSPDDRTVYFYDRRFTGIAIRALDLATGTFRTVKARTNAPLDWLQVTADGHLLYAGGRDGIDNVYSLDPATGAERQLTNLAIGARTPHQGTDGALYYSEATPTGYHLHRLVPPEPAKANGLPGGSLPAGPNVFERPAAFAAEAVDLPATLEARTFPVSEFSDNLGGIKLHSWSYNGSYVAPGLSVEATNALNTVQLQAEGRYNLNEKRYSGGIGVAYGGLYPVLTARGQFRDRSYAILDPARDTFVISSQEFNEVNLSVGVQVPLTWVSGEYQTRLAPRLGLGHYALGDAEEGVLPATFSSLDLGFSFATFQRRAPQHVQSRLGLSLAIDYVSALGESLGSRFLLRSAAQFPGLHRNHGLRVELDYQREPAGNAYQFVDGFRYARGYNAPVNDAVYRLGVNYQLPLLYPDFGIAGITYFKRIRLNAFYDYSRYRIDQFRNSEIVESSVGGELFFDNVWMNAQEIAVGLQFAYRLDPDFFSRETNDLRISLLFGGFF